MQSKEETDNTPTDKRPGVSFIKLSVDLIKSNRFNKNTKCVRRHKSKILRMHKSFQIYKTMRTSEPVQKSLYKSHSGEDCAYVHLHFVSSPKSPYMELTMPSFTMHILICISFPCIFPSTWHHVSVFLLCFKINTSNIHKNKTL